MNEHDEYARFAGWDGGFALFGIDDSRVLPDGSLFEGLLAAREGDWTDSAGDDMQQAPCRGLRLTGREYSAVLNRTLFSFELERPAPDAGFVLAVPATGEELRFEIYGVNQFGALQLLAEREL